MKKKQIIIVSLLTAFIFIALFIFIFKNNRVNSKFNTDYVSLIMQKSDFDEGFLKWVSKEYADVLASVSYAILNNNYNDSIWHDLTGNSLTVLNDLYHKSYDNNEGVSYIKGNKDYVEIGFTGDISLADNWEIMPKYQSSGGINGILSEDILGFMNNEDYLIVNNEFSFSNRGTPLKSKRWTFRANPENVSIYKEMGVDMVTLGNNHVYDYGNDAFLDTLSTLKNAQIPYIGAGENINEASKAHYLIINGYKIAFLNATRAEKYILTPGANESDPGVFRCYDPANLVSRIKEEKKISDYVVVLLHWGKEESHNLEEAQKETGKLYIDSGADLIVGSHAHVLQGSEFYQDKLIMYNLGDFIFSNDQTETGIFSWRLKNDGTSEYYFLPSLQKNCYTSILKGNDANNLYSKMTSWSVNALFNIDGSITKKA